MRVASSEQAAFGIRFSGRVMSCAGSRLQSRGQAAIALNTKLEGALTETGRGTCKERSVPRPNDRPGFEHRSGCTDLHQNDKGCSDGYGRNRMHDDAQRAMVSVRFERVDVGHLDHHQQRQQSQAHHRRNREESRARAAVLAS